MALFLCATMYQGDERFSVQTRGKQCAFISLAAVITAQNNPLIDWSTTLFDHVLSQGDQMYLKALNEGLIVLEQGVEFLSIDNLPKVVSVSGCSSMFSYDITDTVNLQPVRLLVVVAQNNNDLPIVVEPSEARNNDNLPVPIEEKNENQILYIKYGDECQGLVTMEGEIESHYYNIHTALLNAFFNDSYAILILEGCMMALIKQTEFFYPIDSHARDLNGMPNPNGTAVVMKFANILELEQYLYCLAVALNTNLFEIVPLHLHKCGAQQKAKCAKDQDYLKKRRSVETELDKQLRLKNANVYKKRQQLN